MIYQLRGKDIGTVCDIEIYPVSDGDYIELKSSVLVNGYSKLLLREVNRSSEVIQDFYNIEEMRGWLWETYFACAKNIYTDRHLKAVCSHVKKTLNDLAKKYDLWLYED